MGRRAQTNTEPPEIAEIRRVRARLYKAAGGTPEGYAKFLRDMQLAEEAGGAVIQRTRTAKKKSKRAKRRAA